MSDPYDPGPPFRRSSPYSYRRDPFTGKTQFHSGQDFSAPEGTPIPAATPGEVVYSGFNDNLGNTVIVKNAAWYSLYAHMHEAAARAPVGQRVWPGDTIGHVGSTGARTTGPHLHYSVIESGANITRTNVGGRIGVALNKDNTIDPSAYDTAVPYTEQTAKVGPSPFSQNNADRASTFENRWSLLVPIVPFPLEALLSSDRSSALEKWSSTAPSSPSTPPTSPRTQSSVADLIMDRIRRQRERNTNAPQASAFDAGAPAVPFVPANDPVSPDRPASFEDCFDGWSSSRRLSSPFDVLLRR